jgi:SpoVK/Ycf46/Vps4 family AAA+-type ATPase
VDIRFYLDESGEPHIHNHHVEQAEVEEVLRRPLEDRSGAERTRVAIGRTEEGRFLRVIYVPDPNRNAMFVITAYDLRPKALKALRRRLRRRR